MSVREDAIKKENRYIWRWHIITSFIAIYLLNTCRTIMLTAFSSERSGSAFSPITHARVCLREGTPWGGYILALVIAYALTWFVMKQKGHTLKRLATVTHDVTAFEDKQTYGDGHYSEPWEYEDVAPLKKIENVQDFPLATVDKEGKKVISLFPSKRGNNNKILFAPSGGGKSYGIMRPAIFQSIMLGHSFVATTPDGELAKLDAKKAMDNGYCVRIYNLANVAFSHCIDITAGIRPEFAEDDISKLSALIVDNFPGDDEVSAFKQGAKSLLQAVWYRIYFDPLKKDKSLAAIYDELNHEDKMKHYEALFDPALIPDEARPAIRIYHSALSGSDAKDANVRSCLLTGLEALTRENIRRFVSTDDFDLTRLGREKCAVFCVFPKDSSLNFLKALFFALLSRKLNTYADSLGSGLPVKVHYILDEFANIGILPDWDEEMAQMRKKNIDCLMAVQNLGQLYKNYGEDAATTIMANCDTHIIYGISDEKTARHYARRLGLTTVAVTTEKRAPGAIGMLGPQSVSIGEGKTELLPESAAYLIGIDECIIIFARHYPVYAWKYRADLHPLFSNNEELDLTSMPKMFDAEARAKYFKEEEERIAEYNRTHASIKTAPPSPKPDVFESDVVEETALQKYSHKAVRLLRSLKVSLKEKILGNKIEPEEQEEEPKVYESDITIIEEKKPCIVYSSDFADYNDPINELIQDPKPLLEEG